MLLTTFVDLTGPSGWVAMLLPWGVLAVVVIGVVIGRDRAPEASMAVAGQGSAVDVGRALRRSGHAHTGRPVPEFADEVDSDEETDAGEHGLAEEVDDEGRIVSAATSDLERRLAEAEQRFDDIAVARLSLEIAAELTAAGAAGRVVQTHLRRAIILASRLGDEVTQARARLELGDALAEEDDMTSACEHWQIARQLFESHDAEALKIAEQRMKDNGCPTDWVLNDF